DADPVGARADSHGAHGARELVVAERGRASRESLAMNARRPSSPSISPDPRTSGGSPPNELRGCLMMDAGTRYQPRLDGRVNGPTDSPNTSFWPDASPTCIAPIRRSVFITRTHELKQPAS